MNPKPFWALKNFTVPVAIMALLHVATPVNPTRADRAADKASEFWGDDLVQHPKIGSVARQAENLGCADGSIPTRMCRQTGKTAVRRRVRAGFAWRRARAARSRS